MDNLGIWNKFSRPPKEALKTIGGGRLKGMSDVNPQWRLKAMTEQFGAIGIGWKYKIVEHWNEAMNGEVACFVKIELFFMNGEVWSEPIEGLGGSMLLTKESKGLYLSDEGYKMALTDALSVAMKQLGVAADIYAGLWDGSKYRETPPTKQPDRVEITEAQQAYIDAVGEKLIDSLPENMAIDTPKLAALLFSLSGKYPDNLATAGTAANVIVSTNKIQSICKAMK